MASKAVGAAALVLGLAASAADAQSTRKGDKSAALAGNPAQFFGPDQYPPEALRKGEQGRVVAKLQVAADGRVTACDLDQSSGSPSLDATTCDIALKKVTFTPARDRRGRAVASTYTLPVRWVLPDQNAPPPPTPRMTSDQQMQLDISADDKLLGCKLLFNGKPYGSTYDAYCANIGKYSPVQLHPFKGELGGAHALVTIQRALQFEGGQPVILLHAVPGRKVLSLTRTMFDVLPDGTVSNARVVEQIGLPGQAQPEKTLGSFVAASDRTDKAAFVESISVVAAP